MMTTRYSAHFQCMMKFRPPYAYTFFSCGPLFMGSTTKKVLFLYSEFGLMLYLVVVTLGVLYLFTMPDRLIHLSQNSAEKDRPHLKKNNLAPLIRIFVVL